MLIRGVKQTRDERGIDVYIYIAHGPSFHIRKGDLSALNLSFISNGYGIESFEEMR